MSNSLTSSDLEMLEANKHIPDDEVRKDIKDTLREIMDLDRQVEHLESTPPSAGEYRMNLYRAVSYRGSIDRRKMFVENLRMLLKLRGVTE